MKSLLEYISFNENLSLFDNDYINRNSWTNKIGNIIFQLDESSLELLDDEFKQILEDNNNVLSYDIITEEKYYDKTHKNKSHGNRTIWTSNDGDELKMGDHANSRKDRPIEKGGDGKEPIKQYEITNMFIWAWDDIIEMNYDGKLKPIIYNNKPSSFTLECQCWLNTDKEHNNKIIYGGARPKDMNLWAAWMLEENGSKLDIIIKTIFRGQTFSHSKTQERIRIRANGNIEQRYKEV